MLLVVFRDYHDDKDYGHHVGVLAGALAGGLVGATAEQIGMPGLLGLG
jgi:hypothetical protein